MTDLPALDPKAEYPWMYFGSFSRTEVEGAAKALHDAGIAFEIIEEPSRDAYPIGGWSGPFALWIREEHTAAASSLLVPYFAHASESKA